MPGQQRREGGYSLIEVLVVLGILTVLVAAGFSLNSRTDARVSAVRGVMGEIEGLLIAAQHKTALSTSSVSVITDGTWAGAGANALSIDGRPFDPTDTGTDPFTRTRIGALNEVFRSRAAEGFRPHTYASIDTDGTFYPLALATRAGLLTVEPVKSDTALKAALEATQRLCNGGPRSMDINGLSKRFTTGWHLVVVGTRNGKAIPNGPIGVLVAPANSGTIYQFYLSEGDETWRRL